MSPEDEPKVWNFYYDEDLPDDAVVIMRPSEWGNPFRVRTGYTREQAIADHRKWVIGQPAVVDRIRGELRGKHLACCCKPKSCHGDFLLLLANLDTLI